VEPEDVVHVLRNVEPSLKPRGLLLDVHPTADDSPIRAGGRGLGFVDARRFQPIVDATNAAVDSLVGDGAFEDVRRVEREIEELYLDPDELIGTADDWVHLRLPAATQRRIRAAEPPFRVLWHVGLPPAQKASGSTASPILTRPASTTVP
jgi:hypothetical protein